MCALLTSSDGTQNKTKMPNGDKQAVDERTNSLTNRIEKITMLRSGLCHLVGKNVREPILKNSPSNIPSYLPISRNILRSVHFRAICSPSPSSSLFHQSSPISHANFRRLLASDAAAATARSTNEESASSEAAEDAEKLQQHTENLKRKTRIAFYFLGGSIVATLFGSIIAYGKPRRDINGDIITDEFSKLPLMKQYILRTWNEYLLWYYYIVEPSSEKLLPDPLPPPYYQPRYTLVLELNGVLIHPEWTYSTGWRFKKRPALDKFVQDVGYPHFEVVIYTNEQGAIAHPLLDNIDPEWRFMHRLYRDATKYMNHTHVKDLSKLNRDLSKVIFVDWDSQAFQLNPENALRVPKWQGDDEDRGLLDLASLLLMIADSNVDDIRPVVQYYSQFDDPIKAYVENRKRILEEKMHKMEQKKEHQSESLTRNFAGRLFGYKRHTSS